MANDIYAFTGHTNQDVTITVDGLNRFLSGGGVTYSYDNRGNMTADGVRSYAYDFDNRLTSVTGGGTGDVSLSYDPAGRLYQTAQVSGATTRFLYDGANLIGEYNASNTLLRRYVQGPGLDAPLVRYDGTGTSNRRWLITDERGSVVAETNASGAAVQINTYDEYGMPGSGNTSRFGYTGQMWIAEIGLYHYRNRVYNPAIGRFMQTDPIGQAGGINLYAYVGNDPINYTDPWGLSADCPPSVPNCVREPGQTVTGTRRTRASFSSIGIVGGFFGGWASEIGGGPGGTGPDGQEGEEGRECDEGLVSIGNALVDVSNYATIGSIGAIGLGIGMAVLPEPVSTFAAPIAFGAGAGLAFAGGIAHTASGIFHGSGLGWGWDVPGNYENLITGPIATAGGYTIGRAVGQALVRGRAMFSRPLQSRLDTQTGIVAGTTGAGIDTARTVVDFLTPKKKSCPQGG